MFFYQAIPAALLLCAVAVIAEKAVPLQGIAYLEGPPTADGKPGVRGNVTFTQNACGENVFVRVYIVNVAPGKHGFHVHDKGDLTNGCASTGGHYNPDKVTHGGPEDEIRHVGDLGNVEADITGIVDTHFTDSVINLSGHRSIIGRAVVLHDMIDDLGQGTHPDSKKTGNAGGRIGCGIIGYNSNTKRSFALCQTPHKATFYVPHQQPHDHVVYPILSPNFPYPYFYTFPYFH